MLSNFCRYNSLTYDQLLFSLIVLAPPNFRRKRMDRQDRGGMVDGVHAPTKQPRQPFISQSAMRGSHVLDCNGVMADQPTEMA